MGVLLGLLGSLLIGAVATTAVVGTAYYIYKVLTKDKIKEEVQKEVEYRASYETLEKIFDIKVKEKIKKGEVFTVEQLEEMAEEDAVVVDVRDRNRNTIIPDIVVKGDELGDDIRVGTVIKINE